MDRIRSLRIAGAALAASAMLALAGCGMNVQTLHEYTPAHGVNAQTGDVKVRNLLIVANNSGKGVLSASFSTVTSDEVTDISGVALQPNGDPAGALTFSATRVTIPANQLVVLTDESPLITVEGSDMKPGLNAKLTLSYASGGTVELVTPVVSADDPTYKDIKVG